MTSVSRKTLYNYLKGATAISPEFLFSLWANGFDVLFILTGQRATDLAAARRRAGAADELAQALGWLCRIDGETFGELRERAATENLKAPQLVPLLASRSVYAGAELPTHEVADTAGTYDPDAWLLDAYRALPEPDRQAVARVVEALRLTASTGEAPTDDGDDPSSPGDELH